VKIDLGKVLLSLKMKKRPGTWVSLLLLLLLLCCVSAEEQQSNLDPNKDILSDTTVSTIIEEQTESKLENEDDLKTNEPNDVHDHDHVQDDHHDHVDGHDHVDDGEDHFHHDEVKELAVERDDLITVKKGVHAWETPSKVPPPWDPLSSIGKPPPTRPPYK
jgi:hypothetical protein